MKSFIFSNKILNQVPTESRKKLHFMTFLVIIMASLSGLFGGVVFTQLLDKPFMIGFIIMFIVSFLLESFMATYSKKSFLWLRILIALLLAIIYALALDTVFFEKSINNFYKEQNQQKILTLDSLYQEKANVFYIKITNIEAQSDSLNKKRSEWSSRVFSEINRGNGKSRGAGYGKFAKKFEELAKKDEERFAPQFLANTEKIAALNEGLKNLKTEKKEKIEALIAPKERGLADRLNALEHLIFRGGSTNMLILYIGFFLLCLTLECLIIFMKRKFDFAYTDYGYVVEQERTHEQAIHNYSRIKQLEAQKTIMDEQHHLQTEASKEQLRHTHQDEIEQLNSENQRKKQVRDLNDYEQGKLNHLRASLSGDDTDFTNWKQGKNKFPLNGQPEH
jgi:hypothetical protein